MLTGTPDATGGVSVSPSTTGDRIPKPLLKTPPAKGHAGTNENLDQFPSTNPSEHGGKPTNRGDVQHTKDGLPLISTRNGGKVVLLTGATGPGHFEAVEGFYSKIVNNRLDYANTHGFVIPFLRG